MWHDYPMNDEVYWSKNQKVIGVLGVAPMATADFCLCLANRPVRKDWEHPRVLVDSNPKIPSRGRFLEWNEADPVPFMIKKKKKLAGQGASIIAVPCNTAHILYARYTQNIPVSVPNMIGVATAVAQKMLADCHNKRVLVLASRQVIFHQLYKKPLEDAGLTYFPSIEQELIGNAIEAVKQNSEIAYWKMVICKHIMSLLYHGIGAVLLGCTELSVLLRDKSSDFSVPIIDSNQTLADYCHMLATSE
jgi:aspartate racemase